MAGARSSSQDTRRWHSGAKFFARKERPCNTWWHSRCVIRGDGQDELSVPCAMFDRCMYAAQRDDYTTDELDVLDAWAHGRVCLLYFSDAWPIDTGTVRTWENL